MLELLFAIMAISFAVERIVDYIFEIKFMKYIDAKTEWIPMKKYSSIGIGLVIAFQGNIDFINMVLSKAEPSKTGHIIAALLIAGGSNIVSDLIKKITELKKG